MAQAAAKKDTSKAFVGTWELLPAESKFEFDNPPRKATILVKPEKGGLFMRAEWLDPKSKKGEIEHELVFNKPTLVNGVEVTLELIDAATLDTIVAKEGAELSRVRRTLSKDGKTMELKQTGTLPNKKAFTNVSKYKKVK
ncbi:MAG: hypothetical protein Q8L48_22375 [Archangium sp.]|nr:hypothetical protein [Archangium sp.]